MKNTIKGFLPILIWLPFCLSNSSQAKTNKQTIFTNELLTQTQFNYKNVSTNKAAQFNPKTSQWNTAQTIPNMNQPEFINTTGKFSWAVGDPACSSPDCELYFTKAAFNDGNGWQPAQSIKNLTFFNAWYPGYPKTGTKPTVWTVGENASGTMLISYFDGKSWAPGKQISPEFNYIDVQSMRTSQGHAWVYNWPNDGKPVYYTVSDPNDPSKWQTPQVLAHVTSLIASAANNSIDLLAVKKDDGKDYLLKVSPIVHAGVTPPTYPIPTNNIVDVDSSGNTFFVLSGKNGIPTTLYFGDLNNSWQAVPLSLSNPKSEGSYTTLNSIFCEDASTTNPGSTEYLQIKCLDANSKTPIWQSSPVFNTHIDFNDNESIELSPDGKTAWITAGKYGVGMFAFGYDLATRQWINTDALPISNKQYMSFDPLNNQRALLVGGDISSKKQPSAYYYTTDSTGHWVWIRQPISGFTNFTKVLSQENGDFLQVNRFENIWVTGN